MSVCIIDPFNQVFQFTKGFCHQKEFSNEFLKSIQTFVQNIFVEKDDKTINLDFSLDQLEILLLKRFDILLTDVTHEVINNFLMDIFSFSSSTNIKNEIYSESIVLDKFRDLLKKEFKITPYVSEKFFPFLLSLNQVFELKLVFKNIRDKCVFNFLSFFLDLEKIDDLRIKIKGKI